jgi:ABC-type multidrug transport system fused ATPase/permease subunit
MLLLAGTGAALVTPLVLGWIVDLIIESASPGPLIVAVAVLVCAGTLSAVCTWRGGILLTVILQSMLAELREEALATTLRLDAGMIERAGSSDVVSRLTGDVDAVTEAGAGVLPRLIGALFTIVLTAIGMIAIDPVMALAALVAMPLQALALVRFLRRSRPLYVRVRRQESDRGQAIIEAVAGAETIRAHGSQTDHTGLVAHRSLGAVETQRQAARARNTFNGTLNLAEFVGLAAILTAGFWRVDSAGVTIGAVTAAALFFHRLFGPIGTMLSSVDDLQRAQAGLERIVGILRAEPRSPRTATIRDAGVRLRGVSYHYPGSASGRPALTDIDLGIAAGTTAVLVGASGSGKSTVARLIAGLLAPDAGEVCIGGVAADGATRGDSRSAVLLVTQETHLFAGTLRDNLRLARSGATDPELCSALRAVGAGWFDELPDGLDTLPDHTLDEQKIQQLALARVLIADPPVVVLDEATAHDGADHALDVAVRAATRGRTAVIVAHRLSHIDHADLVAVFERGRIVECGAPQGLLGRPSRLRAIWDAWTSHSHPATPEEK